MEEESLRLTAAEGTDSKGKEVCAMVVVVLAEEIEAGKRYIYSQKSDIPNLVAYSFSPQSPL